MDNITWGGGGRDKKTFVSSTQPEDLQCLGTDNRSLTYTVNCTGPSIDPWGTPNPQVARRTQHELTAWGKIAFKPGQSRHGDTDDVEFHKQALMLYAVKYRRQVQQHYQWDFLLVRKVQYFTKGKVGVTYQLLKS